jgi:isopentenyl phosphate kinase
MQILKLGGSVITKKHGYMSEDSVSIARLSREIAKVWHSGVRDIIIIHGAGSFGHGPVLKYRLNNGIRTGKQRAGYSATHAACAKLSGFLVDALVREGVPAISLPPSSLILQSNRRIVKFDTSPVFGYLKSGFLPTLYGDMVPDRKLVGSVCSGDQIVAYLGKKAKRIVIGTNVDGVLVDGKPVPLITKRNLASIRKHLRSSSAPDVTGGMEGKIKELLSVRKPAYIANARKGGRIAALLLGKKTVCTKLRF